MITNKMLNFKPKVFEDYITYERVENNNTVTLKTKLRNIPTKVVNKPFYHILKLCNGHNTVDDIIKDLQKKYPNVNKKQLENDTFYVFKSLVEIQALENSNVSFIRKFSNKITMEHKINYFYYSEIDKLRKYGESIPCAFFNYENPVEFSTICNSLMNYKQINNNEGAFIFYITNTNEEIVGLIIWKTYGENCVVLDSLILSDDTINLKKVISTSLALVSSISKQQYKIFRVFLMDEDKFYNILKNLEFFQTAILKKEIDNDIDLYELSFYI